MTLLGLYRVVNFKGTLKLSTITQPFKVSDSFMSDWIEYVIKDFSSTLLGFRAKINPRPISLSPIQSSSPTSRFLKELFPTGMFSKVSSDFSSLWLSAHLWLQSSSFDSLKRFSSLLGYPYFSQRIRLIGESTPKIKAGFLRKGWANWVESTTLDRNPDPDSRLISSVDGVIWRPDHTSFTDWGSMDLSKVRPTKQYASASGKLGRLGLKFEAAGKIRVFAMVDAWTQWLMTPLHLLVFDLLKFFKTDGTFNQRSPILNLIELFQNPLGWVPKTTFYSLDLSAATDRLPIRLQKTIVSLLYELFWLKSTGTITYGDVIKSRLDTLSKEALEFGDLWEDLLVNRFYYLSLSHSDLKKMDGIRRADYKLKYAVGQPMGALSSWAMLALVHHAIVGFAAKRAKVKVFNRYAVLGDDVVIADSRVAKQYLLILQEIGVSVGLAKSIISKRKMVIEFAKKFVVNSTFMDMIPIKDCITTWISNALVKEVGVKWHASSNQLMSFLGYGYKSRQRFATGNVWKLPSRQRVNLVWLRMPGSELGFRRWFTWITMTSNFDWNTAVSTSVQLEILNRCMSLFIQVADKIDVAFINWKDSYASIDTRGATDYPVYKETQSYSDGTGLVFTDKTLVSWKELLFEPLNKNLEPSRRTYELYHHDSESIPSVDSPKFKSVGLEGYHIIKDIFESYERFTNAHLLKGKYVRRDLKDLIDKICGFIFNNDLIGQIPKEYWPTDRTQEKVFDDFLQSFEYWVYLSAPVWKDSKVNIDKILDKDKVNYECTALVPIGRERNFEYIGIRKNFELSKYYIFKESLYINRTKVIYDRWRPLVIRWVIETAVAISFVTLVLALPLWGDPIPTVQYIKEVIETPVSEIIKYIPVEVVKTEIKESWFFFWLCVLLVFGIGFLLIILHQYTISNLNLKSELETASSHVGFVEKALKDNNQIFKEEINKLQELYSNLKVQSESEISYFSAESERMLLEKASLVEEITNLKLRDEIFSLSKDKLIRTIEDEQDILQTRLISCMEQFLKGEEVPGLRELLELMRRDLAVTRVKIDLLVDPSKLSSQNYALDLVNNIIPALYSRSELSSDNLFENLCNMFMFHYSVSNEALIDAAMGSSLV